MAFPSNCRCTKPPNCGALRFRASRLAPPVPRPHFTVCVAVQFVSRLFLALAIFTCHMPHAACQPHASREIKCPTSCPSVSFLGSFMHLFAFACHRHHHHHHHPHSLLLGARLTDDITVHTPPLPVHSSWPTRSTLHTLPKPGSAGLFLGFLHSIRPFRDK